MEERDFVHFVHFVHFVAVTPGDVAFPRGTNDLFIFISLPVDCQAPGWISS